MFLTRNSTLQSFNVFQRVSKGLLLSLRVVRYVRRQLRDDVRVAQELRQDVATADRGFGARVKQRL